MTRYKEIFPPSNGENDPYVKIAEFVQADIGVIWSGYDGLEVPEWADSQHLDVVKRNAFVLNEAARRAGHLLSTLRRLTPNEYELIVQSGAVTVHQIEHLVEVLSRDSVSLGAFTGRFNRTGGKNPAASIIAEATRKIFRRLRKKITFGQHPDGGPSTEFGRCVEFSLGQFGINADWRRPAQGAAEKQNAIQSRMNSFILRKAEQRFQEFPPQNVDLTGVSVLQYHEGDRVKYLI
jgi:hypothetical protein